MKKKIIIIIIASILLLMLITIFSIVKYEVINPFSTFFGMLEILLTDKEYTVIQEYPRKVVFSKSETELGKYSEDLLDQYMESRGFQKMKDEQMGSMLVYSNGVKKELVHEKSNKFYSIWTWD